MATGMWVLLRFSGILLLLSVGRPIIPETTTLNSRLASRGASVVPKGTPRGRGWGLSPRHHSPNWWGARWEQFENLAPDISCTADLDIRG
jgi:hypothetical protein